MLAAVAVIGIGLLAPRQDGAVAAEARSSSSPAAATLAVEEATRLVREHFPEQYQSAQFHRLWIVRDPDGQVLHTGELHASQDWNHVEEQLRGLQGQTPGPWRRQQLRNGAGQLIELSVSDVEKGEPRR